MPGLLAARGESQSLLPVVQDQFLVCSIGSTLVLKSCGFIESHRARIVDVSANSLRLRLGTPWWRRWLSREEPFPVLDVALCFHRIQDVPLQAPQVPQSRVVVTIRPGSRFVSSSEFHRATRHILWRLRYHFMACA